MTYQEINQMVGNIGLPYAYYQFPDKTEQAPPFVVFYYPNGDDFAADNSNYVKIKQLNIELYTDNKDFTLEQTVETVLKAHDLVYLDDETYIDSERMFMHLYQMEVLIDG